MRIQPHPHQYHPLLTLNINININIILSSLAHPHLRMPQHPRPHHCHGILILARMKKKAGGIGGWADVLLGRGMEQVQANVVNLLGTYILQQCLPPHHIVQSSVTLP